MIFISICNRICGTGVYHDLSSEFSAKPESIILTVADPDTVFARAVAAGASEVYPVGEEYGWRLGHVDPFGHHWEVGRPLA